MATKKKLTKREANRLTHTYDAEFESGMNLGMENVQSSMNEMDAQRLLAVIEEFQRDSVEDKVYIVRHEGVLFAEETPDLPLTDARVEAVYEWDKEGVWLLAAARFNSYFPKVKLAGEDPYVA
jgi:hypothetical protein